MSRDNTDVELEADHPLKLPKDDILHRADFCEALADILAKRKGGDSLAVGITGQWGTGKSTIKNFVKHFLEKKDPKPVVIEFNPWEWSGQDKLIEVFLSSLGEAFSGKDVSRKRKRLKLFSKVLQTGEMKFSGWLGFICTFVYELMGRPRSIDALREKIAKDLKNIESPIIVFIDDVDRLSKEEIKLLFQLVRANLRFKNLTFVLLFQRNIVASMLDELTAGNGSDYIGKIIQVEFDIPKASTKDMQTLLLETLKRVLFDGKDQSDKSLFLERPTLSRLEDLFFDHLWHYFRSLRDIKRFSSSFEFYYRRHLNHDTLKVDKVDLIAVEVLRVFDNEAYRKLSCARFFDRQSDEYYRAGLIEEEKKEWLIKSFNQKLEEIVAHHDEASQQKDLKLLLQKLFPQTGDAGYQHSGAKDSGKWHCISERGGGSRICNKNNFHRYFELNIDTSEATECDLDAILRGRLPREHF